MSPDRSPTPNRKRRPAFSAFLYRYRNLVERFSNKLKHFRAVATRYDKRADNVLAGIKLASTRIWMRFNESMVLRNLRACPEAAGRRTARTEPQTRRSEKKYSSEFSLLGAPKNHGHVNDREISDRH